MSAETMGVPLMNARYAMDVPSGDHTIVPCMQCSRSNAPSTWQKGSALRSIPSEDAMKRSFAVRMSSPPCSTSAAIRPPVGDQLPPNPHCQRFPGTTNHDLSSDTEYTEISLPL